MDDRHKWQGIRVQPGVAPSQKAAVARLLWQDFGRRLMPLTGRRRAEAWILSALRPDAAVLALSADDVVGMIGLRDGTGGLLQTEPAGLWLALWRAGPATSDLVIDGLVVDPAWRRRGIGDTLLAAAMAEARARGYRGIRAEVAAGNHAAQRLFRGAGLETIGRARIGPLWSRHALVMRREL